MPPPGSPATSRAFTLQTRGYYYDPGPPPRYVHRVTRAEIMCDELDAMTDAELDARVPPEAAGVGTSQIGFRRHD